MAGGGPESKTGASGGCLGQVPVRQRLQRDVEVDHGGREAARLVERSSAPCFPTGVSFGFVSCEQRSSGLPLPIRGNSIFGFGCETSRWRSVTLFPMHLGAFLKRKTSRWRSVTPLSARQRPSPIPLAFPLCGRGSVPVLALLGPSTASTLACLQSPALSRRAPAERGRARLTLASVPTHSQVFVDGLGS